MSQITLPEGRSTTAQPLDEEETRIREPPSTGLQSSVVANVPRITSGSCPHCFAFQTHTFSIVSLAALAGDGSFLGACALTQGMDAFQHYKTICEATFEQGGDISHIRTRVIPAVDGEFGQFQRYRHAAVMLLDAPRLPPVER